MKMRVNIENMTRQATRIMSGQYKDLYSFSLTELVDMLKELKRYHEAGNSKEALDAFFEIYVFDKNQAQQ
jgi:hypothetical protein